MERNSTHHSVNRNGSLLRSETRSAAATDFVLQWGNRKRLRCMKVQAKDHNNNAPSGSGQGHRRRVDRRVVRSGRNNNNTSSSKEDPNSNQLNAVGSNDAGKSNGCVNGYLDLRQSPASPSHRILRNSESSIGMRSNGGDKKSGVTANNNNNSAHLNSNKNINNNNKSNHHNDNHHHHGGSGSSGSSSGGDTIAATWPPKFVIALTNKEKEEDFMVLKGSKLPQRPKKRAKFIQRTLNLVSPGAWLCDLTLERYEVREKKVTKKRPRGLKAMGNCVDSDSQ